MNMTVVERDRRWGELYMKLREKLRRGEITVCEMQKQLRAFTQRQLEAVSQ